MVVVCEGIATANQRDCATSHRRADLPTRAAVRPARLDWSAVAAPTQWPRTRRDNAMPRCVARSVIGWPSRRATYHSRCLIARRAGQYIPSILTGSLCCSVHCAPPGWESFVRVASHHRGLPGGAVAHPAPRFAAATALAASLGRHHSQVDIVRPMDQVPRWKALLAPPLLRLAHSVVVARPAGERQGEREHARYIAHLAHRRLTATLARAVVRPALATPARAVARAVVHH